MELNGQIAGVANALADDDGDKGEADEETDGDSDEEYDPANDSFGDTDDEEIEDDEEDLEDVEIAHDENDEENEQEHDNREDHNHHEFTNHNDEDEDGDQEGGEIPGVEEIDEVPGEDEVGDKPGGNTPVDGEAPGVEPELTAVDNTEITGVNENSTLDNNTCTSGRMNLRRQHRREYNVFAQHQAESVLLLQLTEDHDMEETELDPLDAECHFLHDTLGWGEGLAEMRDDPATHGHGKHHPGEGHAPSGPQPQERGRDQIGLVPLPHQTDELGERPEAVRREGRWSNTKRSKTNT